jgi:energy-coupling factor transport system permease protein
MSQAFGLYLPRPSLVHRLHPLTKLALAGFFLVSGLALPGLWLAYLLALLGLLPLALLSQVARPLVGRTGRIVLPFMLSVFLIQGLLWPGGRALFGLGPLTFKQEGLQFAVASSGRTLVVIASFLWFALTTRADLLMSALVQRGLPASLAYLLVASLQIAPRFQARATTILEAQRARGLEVGGSWRQRGRALLPLVTPLILSSLIDVEERALAIEARGFNQPGPKTSFSLIEQAAWEPALRSGLLLLAAGALLLRFITG